MDYSTMESWKSDPSAKTLLDNKYDGDTEPADFGQSLPSSQPMKSISTDSFEHILSDKIDTSDNLKYQHRNDDDDLLALGDAVPKSEPIDPFGHFDHKKAATLDFMAAERQQVAPPAAALSQQVLQPEPLVADKFADTTFDYNDDKDDYEIRADDDDDDLMKPSITTVAAPLKASIYDDLERSHVPATVAAPPATAAAHHDKFISSEDLLGDYDDAAVAGDAAKLDDVLAAAPVKSSASSSPAPVSRNQTPDLYNEAEDDEPEVPTPAVAAHEPAAAHFDVVARAPPPAPPTVPKPVAVVEVSAPQVTAAVDFDEVIPAVPARTTSQQPASTVSPLTPRILADEIFCKIGLGESHSRVYESHFLCAGSRLLQNMPYAHVHMIQEWRFSVLFIVVTV